MATSRFRPGTCQSGTDLEPEKFKMGLIRNLNRQISCEKDWKYKFGDPKYKFGYLKNTSDIWNLLRKSEVKNVGYPNFVTIRREFRNLRISEVLLQISEISSEISSDIRSCHRSWVKFRIQLRIIQVLRSTLRRTLLFWQIPNVVVYFSKLHLFFFVNFSNFPCFQELQITNKSRDPITKKQYNNL